MAIIRFYLYSEILIDIKPDYGHIWPEHVVLILTLKNIHLLYIIRVVFLTTLPPISNQTFQTVFIQIYLIE